MEERSTVAHFLKKDSCLFPSLPPSFFVMTGRKGSLRGGEEDPVLLVKEELEAMKKTIAGLQKENKQIKEQCRLLKADNNDLKTKVKEMEERQNKADMRVDSAMKEVHKSHESFADKLKKNLGNPGGQVVAREFANLQDRRFNIIIRGVQESQADEGLDRKEHDRCQAVKVATEAGMDRHLFEGSVVTVRRLGKRNEEHSYRPMLVKLSSQDIREQTLLAGRSRKIRDYNSMASTRYRIDPDLSKEQMEDLKRMREEAANKSGNGVKFYVVGRENPVMRSRQMTEEERQKQGES